MRVPPESHEYRVALKARGASDFTLLATLPSLEIAEPFVRSHAHGKERVSRLETVSSGVWRITADGDEYVIAASAAAH
jgi:hypothetical protein